MVIPGLRYDPSKVFAQETPMGTDPSGAGFSGLEGMGFTDIIKQGDGFRFTRPLEGGADNMYQTRTATLNPDGTVSWKGSWQTKQKQSQMDHFLSAGLPMALAMAGGVSALGSTAGSGAVSGMDLAADAAAGSGNNIFTAGSGLGGGGAADPVGAYLTSGASEGSTIGNAVTGAGGASGAVGSGTVAGSLQGLGGLFGGNPLSTLNTGRQLGGLLGGVLGGATGGSGGGYDGPMPTISREGWKASVTPRYMSLMGDVQMPAKKGAANSGLWQFLGK